MLEGKQVRGAGNEQGRTELLVDFMVQWVLLERERSAECMTWALYR